jgi:hypothetical protein
MFARSIPKSPRLGTSGLASARQRVGLVNWHSLPLRRTGVSPALATRLITYEVTDSELRGLGQHSYLAAEESICWPHAKL